MLILILIVILELAAKLLFHWPLIDSLPFSLALAVRHTPEPRLPSSAPHGNQILVLCP
ncbi:hypothetical protein AAAK29_26040 [Mesorhizobium sp. CCNWLW179-1]|uniref:hypothetical protein n=1 Tax=unclassified Mesorhizobium TaxID=325217 RepID=UPI0030154B37